METSILKHDPVFWAVCINSENFVCFARVDRKPLFWPGFQKTWFCLCVSTANALVKFYTQDLKNVFLVRVKPFQSKISENFVFFVRFDLFWARFRKNWFFLSVLIWGG